MMHNFKSKIAIDLSNIQMGKIPLTGYDYPAKVFLDGSNP
jgi:hypothetical protein